MSAVANYPNASPDDLKAQYVGRMLQDVDGPAAVIDIAAAKQNCQLMLEAADSLGVLFRSHVKTHKTTELARLQVGEKAETVRLVVSTLAEAEQLKPYLEECKGKGRSIDLIYGLPVQPSCFKRLAALGKSFGGESISVLVDSTDILSYLPRYQELTGHRLGVFMKLDTGNNRAGLAPDSKQLGDLLDAVHKLEQHSPSDIKLRGFYSHMGRSYGSDSTTEALDYLAMEIERCEVAAAQAAALSEYAGGKRRFIIAVGATPTTTSAQNLSGSSGSEVSGASEAERRVKQLIQRVQKTYDVELHAGAYVTLDMQQLAAHARPSTSHLSFDNLALTVLAEVASLYPHREKPEALVACGQLCLGREPCRSYHGWGVLTPWQHDGQGEGTSEKLVKWYDPEGDRTGWIVDRLSQEHGILGWQGSPEGIRKLRLGEKVRIWPNHCCICMAGFSYALIVDSTKEGAERDRIIDIWLSWRGW